MKGMRNLWAMFLCLVLLGGLTACAGTGESMAKDSMMDPKEGMAAGDNVGMSMKNEMSAMLRGSDGHHAAGKVSFDMGMNDSRVLTLSDINVDKVPDGYVYLAKNGDWMHGVQLGMLKQFSGTVTYTLPDGINPDDFDTVVIWCKKFNVEIGRAHFGEKMN